MTVIWCVDNRHTLCYICHMKYFSWDNEKNEQFKQERGVSFEQIVYQIEAGEILDIIENPKREKYADQFIFVIELEGYAYLVPYVEDEYEVFLKTIIPNRKATKKYLKG